MILRVVGVKIVWFAKNGGAVGCDGERISFEECFLWVASYFGCIFCGVKQR